MSRTPPEKDQDSQGKLFLALSGFALLAGVTGWASGNSMLIGPGVVGMLCFLAIYFQRRAALKTFAFTFWVFAFFIGALFYPEAFLNWGSFKQSRLIVPLIQLIMFGMGATLSLSDFGRALRMPKAVGIGMFLQFTVMPVAGWAIAHAFGFDPEVATGIILIGSCSGGVASNVMAYLARGNVALSVTMTACSTIVSPLMTPLLMKLLAGELMEINVFDMMISIVELIILPIGAGLITNAMLHAKTPERIWRPIAFVLSIVFFVAGLSGFVEPVLGPIWGRQMVPLAVALLLMSLLRQEWLENGLPVVSMAGICYIIAIIAASNQEKIMTVGAGLFGAALIHNCLGYLLGYWGARAVGVEEGDARTIAFEVGMQNGMGTALAMEVLKSPSAALGPAIFGTWMNISGSTLASWWKERPPQQTHAAQSVSS